MVYYVPILKTLIIYDIMDTYEDGSHYRIYALFHPPIYSILHYIFLLEDNHFPISDFLGHRHTHLLYLDMEKKVLQNHPHNDIF